MPSDPPSRTARLMLVVALVVVAIFGVTLALIGLSTPGYADGKPPNPILQAFLQEAPTPVPTPVATACGVQVAQRMTIVTRTMGIELVNEGAAATVRAITVAWPPANGELREVRLGDLPIWTGAAAGHSATVFPDLTEMLPTIKAGEQASLTLLFSNTATDEDYFVLLHLGNSCYATFDSSQNMAQIQSCFATFDRFDVNGQEAVLVVRNTTAEPIPLRQLLIFWPDDHGTISSIQIDDGENLISEPVEESPARIPLPRDPGITLQPEQSSTLRLTFNGAAPLVNYSFVLQSDGCQSVFSNAEAPSECPVRQEGNLQVIGRTVGLVLQNPSEVSQSIEGIWLTFPASNTALVDVTLDGSSIVDASSGLFPKTSSPASMTAGVDLLPAVSLNPNSRSALGFDFSQDAALEHYTVEVDLSGGCRVLTTTRSEEPEPCQMEIDGEAPLLPEGNQLRLAIRNTGSVPAELTAVQVDWAAQINGALTGVALGGVPFWEGERTGGTATVAHNTDNVVPPVEPGQSVELQFTFTNDVVEAPYVFRMDFAEGCSLSYATQPDLAMPTPVEFFGAIRELPENAFDGDWLIEVSATQVFSVQVTPQTMFVPPGLTPMVNDFAHVRAFEIGDNRYLATTIRVKPNFNQAEPTQLSGLIEQVDPEQPVKYIVVQGFWVNIMPDTEIVGDLVPGYLAEIDGFLRADGTTVLATRIETTAPEDNVRRVDFQGFVEDWWEESDQEAVWIISGMRAIVNRDSTILHGIEWGVRPENDVEVRVAGDMFRAGTVRATELWYGTGAEEIYEFQGFIRELPDTPQLRGTWIIEDSAVGICDLAQDRDAEACKRVDVTDATFVDISEASPAVDAPVHVRARQNLDGSLTGLLIKILVPDVIQ